MKKEMATMLSRLCMICLFCAATAVRGQETESQELRVESEAPAEEVVPLEEDSPASDGDETVASLDPDRLELFIDGLVRASKMGCICS